MGKYMRKAKTAGEVALTEVAQTCLGVRTRAKTLALQQRLHNSPPHSSSAAAAAAAAASGGSYLQLRSRRLHKPPIIFINSAHSKRQGQTPNRNPNSRLRLGSMNSGSSGSGCLGLDCFGTDKFGGDEEEENHIQDNNNNNVDMGLEASFGENVLVFEGIERSTRESTPCSFIRDPESIRTPGSTTRPTSSTESNRRVQNSMRGRHIPTAHEMDELFTGLEEQQQKQFTDKYNFDPVNDEPLPGRYEWVKLDP